MTRISDGRDLGAFIPAALDDYPLAPIEFRVYCRIVRRAGAEGCYESNKGMAEALKVGERVIREAKALLTAAGLVRKGHRRGTVARYWLTPTEEWVKPGEVEALRETTRRPKVKAAEQDTGAVQGTAVLATAVLTTEGSGPDDRTTAVLTTDKGTPGRFSNEGEVPTPASPTTEPRRAESGFPLQAVGELTYARSCAAWLREQGITVPKHGQRSEAYRIVLAHMEHFVPDDKSRTGPAIGVINEYVSDVAEGPLAKSARSHLGRLVKEFGPVLAFDGVAAAVVGGAGLSYQYEGDLQSLTKYARGVINKLVAA